MAVAVVLMAIGVPSFKNYRTRTEVENAATKIQIGMNYARSEAVSRGGNVTLCPVVSEGSNECSQEAILSDGWIIVDDKGSVIKRQGAFKGKKMTVKEVGGKDQVTFNRLGITNGTRDYVICPGNKEASMGKVISLERMGSTFFGGDNDKNGIPETFNGENIACDG